MTPTRVHFAIVEVFDIASRGGLLVVGHLTSGVIHQGMTLSNEANNRTARVIAIEFLTGTHEPDRRTLVIDRADAAAIEPGATLVTTN
ncbi:hypothetical protein OG394_01145 [Kribbella sp. NBC_01245]|uniref:hypothetical protein n=1 Tax=Kribbella sp. NBC_01245 TaxID=2903578 RepID=UPI002E2AD00F|nr:hypothetical protein [Kribbella sp. NBC_01245]